MSEQELVECIYCYHLINPSNVVPAVDDDDAWQEAAKEHAPDCDWINTRANRLDGLPGYTIVGGKLTPPKD